MTTRTITAKEKIMKKRKQKVDPESIERDVVFHVQRYTKYHEPLKEPYCVDYDGKLFSSKDTRDLVIQIMRDCHGVELSAS